MYFCAIAKEDIKFWGEFAFAAISAISAVISLIAIYLLIKERREKNRPYLQVSFELVRSSLACVIFRNVGVTPLTVKSIVFAGDFLSQLGNKKQDSINRMKNVNIDIFPERHWILSLDVNVFDIIEKFNPKSMTVSYEYSNIKKIKRYKESNKIDFEEYRDFLVYISEIDEFRQSNERYQNKIIKAIKKNTIAVTTLQDPFKAIIGVHSRKG